MLSTVAKSCSLRSTKIDPESQLQKLRAFINPVEQLWQNPELSEAISSFDGFCELLGLNKVKDYLVSRRANEIQDWGVHQLDAEGQAIQNELDERVRVSNLQKYLYSQLTRHSGPTPTDYQIFLWLFYGKD